MSRQRQQYWQQGLRRQLLLAGLTRVSRRGRGAVSALKALAARLIIVSTHSVSYRQVRRVDAAPELRLAVPVVGFAGHFDGAGSTTDSALQKPANTSHGGR